MDPAHQRYVANVFGYACKLCVVFVKDKASLLEHVKADDHVAKFTASEETRVAAEKEAADKKAEEEAAKKAAEEEANGTENAGEAGDDAEVNGTEEAGENGDAKAEDVAEATSAEDAQGLNSSIISID